MKFPSLVQKRFCKTKVEVVLYGEGLNEDGSPTVICEYKDLSTSQDVHSKALTAGSLLCNYQAKAKTVYTKEQKIVQVSAVLLFDGDIASSYNVACDANECKILCGGYVVIDGVKREVVQGIKHLNPDGTVNYTELDVL